MDRFSIFPGIYYLELKGSKWVLEKLDDIRVDQPHDPEPQDPELQPPPELIGLTEVIPKPERGPASM